MSENQRKKVLELRKQLASLETQLSALVSNSLETETELEKLLTKESVTLAENSLYSFYTQAWHVFESVPFKGNWHLKCICDHLEAVFRGEIQNIIFEVPPRHSKAQEKSLPVLTTEGWTTHGQLKEGSIIYHPSGKTTRVIKVHPDTYAEYEIEFSNKEKVKCSNQHIWRVWDRGKHRFVNLETQEMIGKEVFTEKNEKTRSRYLLPNIQPLEKPEMDLPLHPYWLGLWLGDGCKQNPIIHHDAADIESINKLESLGFTKQYTRVHKTTGVLSSVFTHQKITQKHKELGIHKNKHIPFSYINSSIEQRCELIAGLIDSDGHVDQNGRVRIINTNKAIIDGAYEILLSLGQRPYVEEREPVDSTTNWGIKGKLKVYSLGFQPTIEFPTAIPRKEISRLAIQRKVGIKSIKLLSKEETVPANCITVDAEDGMYLCGKTLLPTHNSSIINIVFPVWCWLQNPNLKFITCAHGDSLATRDAVKSRQLIESPWFQRNWGDKVRLKAGSNQKTRYENENNGYRIATSISGKAVGEGFDILIVDDPHKPKEINSKAAMTEVEEWWTGTMSSRANDANSRRIVMHQRLADNDLIGYIREHDADNWEIISLPMLYEPTDFVSSIGWVDPRTKENEILWKERFPESEVKRLKNGLGSFGFAAQYQQRPAAKEGGLIKRMWLKYYGLPFNTYTLKNFDLIIQSWDLSFGETGDYTVGQVWGKKGPDKYLLDEVKGKWTFTEQLSQIRRLRTLWPQTRVILVENKANGAAAIDTLKRNIPGFIPINPKEIGGGDKEVRLSACALDFEAGNVWLPSVNIHSWVTEYVHELTTFPRSKHDDSVDATSQALNWFATKAANNIAIITTEDGVRSLNRVAPQKGKGLNGFIPKTQKTPDFSGVSRRMIDQSTMSDIKKIFD